MDAAVSDTLSILRNPPGRKPAVDLTELSAWYNGLPEAEQVMIERLLAIASRQSVFGLFAVLDGARKVDPSAVASDYFELRHIHRGGEDILSGPNAEPLHELL